MKSCMKNIGAIGFLVLFLPYVITLLLNGRQGVHQEEPLPELELKVLQELLEEDLSWMEDGMLDVMALLYRTELLRKGQEGEPGASSSPPAHPEEYERSLQAVLRTRGQAVTVGGEYRELPYHGVSAGHTREGSLLGEEYAYVKGVECPLDLESDRYLQICFLKKKEADRALGKQVSPDALEFQRDGADYVISMSDGDTDWQGESLRSLLHLPSSCFWVEEREDGLRITSKGNGHGFGMSLYTANRMVQEGLSGSDIFQKFYEGAECITIP